MDFSNKQASNVLSTDNWSDALLIKDEKGNFTHLKSGQNNKSSEIDSRISHVSEGKLAPQDDSFLSEQSIKGSSQDKSELVFHPDDKSELDFFAKNTPLDDSKKYSVEKIVARIVEKQKLNFDDKNKKIFTNILYNFFRNRKSASIARDLLTNGLTIKNKKLSTDNIDTILTVIKGIKSKIDLAGGLVVNQVDLNAKENTKPLIKNLEISEAKDKSLSAQDEIKEALGQLPNSESSIKVDPALEKAIKKTEDLKDNLGIDTKSNIPKTDKAAAGFTIPSSSQDISEKTPVKKDDKVQDIKDTDQKSKETKEEDSQSVEASLPKVSRTNINQSPKKAINDVVAASTKTPDKIGDSILKDALTGPVQELQSFDLVGFRRLGDTAKDRIQKIFDKINLLEQDSYTKKAQGIAAWRNSKVYKLYLQIGAESMVSNKEVSDFIKESENNNKDTLSIEEFSAISDLNKQLRF